MANARTFDGSAADQREDRVNAKKHGMTVAQWKQTLGDTVADTFGQLRLDAKAAAKKSK